MARSLNSTSQPCRTIRRHLSCRCCRKAHRSRRSSAPGSTAFLSPRSAWPTAASRRWRRGCRCAARRRHRVRSRGGRRRALARSDHAACRAHEARRRQAAAAAHDGGDGPAGLRPVRLQLPGLRRRDRNQESRQAQPVHSGRQGNAAHAESSLRRSWRSACAPLRRKRRLPSAITETAPLSDARATIQPKRFSCRAHCSTSPARTSTPGTSSSIFRRARSIISSAIASAFSRPTIRRWSMP